MGGDYVITRAVIEALMEPTPEMVEAGEVVLNGREFCADPTDQGFVRHIVQAALRAALNEGA